MLYAGPNMVGVAVAPQEDEFGLYELQFLLLRMPPKIAPARRQSSAADATAHAGATAANDEIKSSLLLTD